MIYVDYVILKTAYDQSMLNLKQALDKREEAFTRTLPNAIRYDLQKVMHSVPESSPLDDYVMTAEKLEEKIREAKLLVIERKEMLDLKEEELRKSQNITNRVFVLRYIEGMRVDAIARKMGYTQEAIYYHIRKIKHEMSKCL